MGKLAVAINNLCFKNSKNKKYLGVNGFVAIVVKIHKRWAATEFDAKTTVDSLKAVGNLSAYPPNSEEIVKEKFVANSCKFIFENLKEKVLIKTTLAVLKQVALKNIPKKQAGMIQQGITETINKVLREYELNEKIVCLCVETLGNIVKNKKLAIQVANRGAIESLLRVITV